MITARNEFETVPAYEHLAGSSFGTWTERETVFRLLEIVDSTTNQDTLSLYKDLAKYGDDDTVIMELADDAVDLLNESMPMPEFCSVTLNDNEYHVMPCLGNAQEECVSYEDYPEEKHGDFILVVNDHGNVTCQQWDYNKLEYVTIWDMV